MGLTRLDYNLVLLLGAGASKPLGIPTSDEMVKEFLETEQAESLSPFKNQIIKEEWDIERLLRLIQHVKILGKEPNLQPLLKTTYTQRLKNKLTRLNASYEEVYDELLKFIRIRCLDPELEKAKQIYEPLLKLGENATIKIFTTNYDTAVENVCKNLQIEFNDGFASSTFDDYKRFYPNRLGKGSVQLYKLHGSVNWWSDINRQVVFRLSLDLEGTKGVKTMMIYPAEIESTFSYPFNILQSHFISSLIDAHRVIAIGHKFGDVNISSPIKALLERRNFKLNIISPDAEKTTKTVFNNHPDIEAVPEKIENWIPEGVKSISVGIKKFEKEREEAIKKAELKRKEERERMREELQEEYRVPTLRPIIERVPTRTLPIEDISLRKLCPNCGQQISVISTSCPYCGAPIG